MSVARFIADQRTNYRVPHTLTCLLLGVSLSWFYKWLDRPPTPRQQRRADLDAAVAAMFDDAKGLHGSPRLHADLRAAGWVVVGEDGRGLDAPAGLVARKVKRQKGNDQAGPVGAEVPRPAEAGLHRGGAEPEVVRRHHRDPHRRREAVPGHGDRLVLPPAAGRGDQSALRRGAVRAGDQDRRHGPRRQTKINNVVFHTDRGSTYTARSFTQVCSDLGVRQSMGVGPKSHLHRRSACGCKGGHC